MESVVVSPENFDPMTSPLKETVLPLLLVPVNETVLPISDEAYCLLEYWVSVFMAAKDENCASSEINSVLSVGLVMSWFSNCAAKSLR